MAGAKNHQYHILPPSIWPFIGAMAALALTGGGVMWMHGSPSGAYITIAGLIAILFVMFSWWVDVIREAHAGDHTPIVQLHLRYGMILFIASEVMFFVAWFWAYFNAALFPSPSSRSAASGRPRAWKCSYPFGYPASQHPDPALLRHHRHLGAP
jgi:cytochrome c oxidase subunit 3